MAMPFDLNGGQKVCDEQGRTVAVVLANQAFEQLTAENRRLREEAARRQGELQELRLALEAAREELKDKAAITAERDSYRRSVLALTRKDFTFTEAEIADMEKNGVTLDEKFFAELERDMRAQGSLDA